MQKLLGAVSGLYGWLTERNLRHNIYIYILKHSAMYVHQIQYYLGCRSCKALRTPSITQLHSEKDETQFSRIDLIDIMENFSQCVCENCGKRGDWICFNIFLNDRNEMRKQLKFVIVKENGRIKGHPEEGVFYRLEIKTAITFIFSRLKREAGKHYPSKSKGSGYIVVDFIANFPFTRISTFDLDGLTIDDATRFMDAVSERQDSNEIYIDIEA